MASPAASLSPGTPNDLQQARARGPAAGGAGAPAGRDGRGPKDPGARSRKMSTRKLIVLALLAGLAILVAFALQVSLIAK
jgi:hypothetical protein